MKPKARKSMDFECCYDGNPMRIAFASDGVIISINDDENDQSKQVKLDFRQLSRLHAAIENHLPKAGKK